MYSFYCFGEFGLIYSVLLQYDCIFQVAWLYNVRGTDVSYSPVVHAFAIVTLNSAFLYVDKRKLSSEVHVHCIII